MSYFSVDVESDGDTPMLYSMISFGAVLISDPSKTFYGKVKPISDIWRPDALAISKISREEHEQYDDPETVMLAFKEWLNQVNVHGRPTLISDNPAYDWQWINGYLHKYTGSNPFGFSARRIGDLYCGLLKDASKNRYWKQLYRKTKHTHHPVDDAMGNAEAMIALRDKLNLRIKF